MLLRLIRKAVKFTLGGTAAYVTYAYLQEHRAQSFADLSKTNSLSTPSIAKHSKKAVVATSAWSPYSDDLPRWLFGRKIKVPDNIFDAVLLRDSIRVEQMLKLNPALVHLEDKLGETVLFKTLPPNGKDLDVELIRLLIRLGANPHHQNHAGESFIMRLDNNGFHDLAAELCRNTGRRCHHKI